MSEFNVTEKAWRLIKKLDDSKEISKDKQGNLMRAMRDLGFYGAPDAGKIIGEARRQRPDLFDT